ncbi:MAG: bestrophin family ion channel [Pseudanabaenaceae cyanobacterium bins.68]|nr:bestrophin family ion channel [Pseudanabaenaceae cyanobacterium bins.68]
MITSNWFRIALQLRGSVVQAILPRTALCSLFGLLIYVIHRQGINLHFTVLSSLIPNIVLGLLLVFRTNTAYERFWEGRKAWGSLVNTVRNLARSILVSVQVANQQERLQKIAALKLLPGFAIALKQHLRHAHPNQELAGLLSVDQFAELLEMHNPPLTLALWLQTYLDQQAQTQKLEPLQLVIMVQMICQMVDALGVCERIQKTPIPLAYAIHLRQLLMLYCLALPFQMVEQLDIFTPVIVGLISFTLLGIEEIGLQIEDPFGHDPNDLPLDQICQTMVMNINDLILQRDR